MATLLDALQQIHDDIYNGDLPLDQALAVDLNPESPDSVWAPVLANLEKTVNDKTFYKLDRSHQNEILQMADAIKHYRGSYIKDGKVVPSFINQIYQVAGLPSVEKMSAVNDKLKTGNFYAVLNLSGKDNEDEILAVPKAEFDASPENPRIYGTDSPYDAIKVTGVRDGIPTWMRVKLGEVPDQIGTYEGVLPRAGLIRSVKTGSSDDYHLYLNNQDHPDAIVLNQESRQQASVYGDALRNFTKTTFGQVPSSYEDWIDEQQRQGVPLDSALRQLKSMPEVAAATKTNAMGQGFATYDVGKFGTAYNKQKAAPFQAAMRGIEGAVKGAGNAIKSIPGDLKQQATSFLPGDVSSAINAASQGFSAFRNFFKGGP